MLVWQPVRSEARSKSNLAKAASNALHTLHVLDSIARPIAVPDRAGIAKVKSRSHDPDAKPAYEQYCCIVFVRAPTPLYACKISSL